MRQVNIDTMQTRSPVGRPLGFVLGLISVAVALLAVGLVGEGLARPILIIGVQLILCSAMGVILSIQRAEATRVKAEVEGP